MINSVVKAIRILQLFNANDPRLTLAEISRRLDIPKSTAHNLLKTLLIESFIEQADGDAYSLGPAIISLTQNVRINIELRDRAAPLVRELAEKCHESVYLTARDGDYVLYIYAIESSHRLLARSAVGDRASMHCTSVGKAILSMLPDAEAAAIANRVGQQRFTVNTLMDWKSLEAELVRSRERGYAVDNEEHEINTFCIGSAIRNGKGQIVGSCSVSGRDPQILGEREEELSQQLITVTQEISRLMGFVPDRLSNLNNRIQT